MVAGYFAVRLCPDGGIVKKTNKHGREVVFAKPLGHHKSEHAATLFAEKQFNAAHRYAKGILSLAGNKGGLMIVDAQELKGIQTS